MTQDSTLVVKGLQVRTTLYDSRFDSGSEGVKDITPLYDSRFQSRGVKGLKDKNHIV